jgi:hypothetical protein
MADIAPQESTLGIHELYRPPKGVQPQVEYVITAFRVYRCSDAKNSDGTASSLSTAWVAILFQHGLLERYCGCATSCL